MAQDRYWTVSRTPEVVRWLDGLPQRDARRIRASIELLHRHGPALGRPRADSIRGTRHHHMKELRSPGRYLRALRVRSRQDRRAADRR